MTSSVVVDPALLLGLTVRVDLLAAPCRRHRAEPEIGPAVLDWARVFELPGDPARIEAAGHGGMASRTLPESPLDVAVLFGQWLAWAQALDDLLDEGQLAGDPTGVGQLFAELLGTLGRADARPHGAGGLADALADLRSRTAPRATAGWRHRFARHLGDFALACRDEAANRRGRHVPTLAEYAALRRGTIGSFLVDLPEALLNAPLPEELVETGPWQELGDACNDVISWSNDVASLDKEHGDAHNFVTVLAHAHQIPATEAAGLVCDLIVNRIDAMRGAAQALPTEFDRLNLTERTARDASRVAVTLLGAPRGHLEWLQDSARYQP